MSRKVNVVGAGIAGLSAAYFLRRRGFEVKLFEETSHLGGLIGTKKAKYGLVETGAHAFMNTAFLEDLCRELGVEMQPISAVAKKYRFLEHQKQITRWPLGIYESLRMFLGIFLFKFFKPKPHESVATWARHVFGKGVASKVVAKIFQGIYATGIDELSANLVCGRFYRKRKKFTRPQQLGSVAPVGGMQSFTDALAERFETLGGTLHLDAKIDGTKLAEWLQNDELVVLATPVWVTAQLLARIEAEVAQDLAKVPSLALSSTTVFWDENQTKRLRPGFGILFERAANASLLGVLENDQIFSGRVWGGGVISETWISNQATDVMAEIKAKRSQLVGGDDSKPLDQVAALWPKSIPLFGKELELAIRKDFSTKLAARGIHLVGNYMGDIGVAKIVERSHTLAQQLKVGE